VGEGTGGEGEHVIVGRRVMVGGKGNEAREPDMKGIEPF
jgi:hypothetical protein